MISAIMQLPQISYVCALTAANARMATRFGSAVRPALRTHIAPQVRAQSRTVRAMATPTVLVPIALGSEEIEVVVLVDVLRRAGLSVTLASVEEGLTITASRGVKLVADCLINDCPGPYDMIALPVCRHCVNL